MNGKRFIIDDCGTLIDIETRNTYDYVSEITELLNNFNKTNIELQDQITKILNTTVEMYKNERTEIGKSVLKQLIEAIQ